ncbi:hypothetical protein ECANGB1_1082 [Enterospora canceri]|uniref:Uncharacterized protein n=1 Tax=Enterospora canceri TaxID=1081671 RepID=A0A1Y1S6T4_9MICR|nr:hypothetical protein ECANGB1_1082 [Enterospora canceri]
MNTANEVIRHVLLPVILVLLVIPVFISTVGTHVLSNEPFDNESRLIFLATFVVGQISYSLITSSTIGVVFFPSLDGLYLLKKVGKACAQYGRSNNVFCNQLVVLFISNFTTFVVAGLIGVLKLGRTACKIPSSVNIAVCLYTGLLFAISPGVLYKKENVLESVTNILVTCFITTGGLILFKKWTQPLILVGYMLLVGLLINGIRLCSGSQTVDNLFMHDKLSMFSIKEAIFNKFVGFEFKGDILSSNIASALTLAFLNVLIFAITILLYSKKLKAKVDLNREFIAFGFANMFTMICPGNLNYACSLLFVLSGKTTKYTAALTGICSTTVFFTYHLIHSHIPIYLALFILQFIGVSYLVDYVPLLAKLRLFDLMVTLCLTALMHLNCGVVIAFSISLYLVIQTRILVSYGIIRKTPFISD